MTVNVDELLKAAGQLGIFVVAAVALWYALLVPRQGKSALLVPGWQHDEAKAELERTRKFYEVMLKDVQDQANVRIGEWRGFRDEAVAKTADMDSDRRQLLEAVTHASQDIALLLELGRRDTDRTKSRG